MKNPTLPPQLHSWSNYGFHYLMAVIYVCNISVAANMKTAYVSFDLMGGTKRALDYWLFGGT